MSHPRTIDGADVLYLLTNEDNQPFYFVTEGDIHHPIMAMAICRYEDSGSLYLFKCDDTFEVQADWDVGSVEEAMEMVENSPSIPRNQWVRIDQ
jgi:hypothetical protein